MIKLPDDVVYALARLKSTIAQCNRLNYCAGAIHELEQAIRLNSTAQPVSAPEWTNEQCLEFLSIAFRHANISGDIEMDDIRLGIRMANAAAKGGQGD